MSRNSALDYVRGAILDKSEKSWSDVRDKSFDWRDQLKKFNDELELNFEILWKKINSGEHSPYSKRVGSKLKHLYKAYNEDLLQDRVLAILPKNPSILRRLFLDEKYNPQDHTLDVLAIYCGCVGWKDLEKKFRKNELQDIEKLCQLGIILNSGESRKIPLEKTSVNSQSSIQPFKQLFTKKRVLLLIGLIILIWVYIYFHDSTSSQNKIHYDELQPVDTIQSQ